MTATGARDTQVAWTIGGALLLSLLVIDAATLGPLGDRGLVRVLLPVAATLLFAFGVRGSGSVTNRSRLGTAALCAFAAVLVARWSWGVFVNPAAASIEVMTIVGQALLIVQFAFALLAAERIARAGVVPKPWAWVPTITVGAVALVFVLNAVASILVRQGSQELLLFLATLTGVVNAASILILGVLAIVLGDRLGRRGAG